MGVRKDRERRERILKERFQTDSDKLDFLLYAERNGKKSADRVLDILGKKPYKTAQQAANRVAMESIGKKAIIGIGAISLGMLLSAANRA